MMQKINIYILGHKILTGIILVVLIAGIYFFFFKSNTDGENRYITEVVKRGNISASITGTGQIEAENTINLISKNTGDITYIGVNVGQEVKKGKLIASVDSRDAKLALENAKISLAKLTKEPDTLTLLQEKNLLTKSYNDGWNMVSSYITDMNQILEEIYSLYESNEIFGYQNVVRLGKLGKSKIELAEKGYYDSRNSLRDLNNLYKSLTRLSSQEEIGNLINKAVESSNVLANTTKETETAFEYLIDYLDYQDESETQATRTSIKSWLESSNGYVVDLLNAINSIEENIQSLNDLMDGSDDLDIKSAELSLLDKQAEYEDCFIYAPFDGVIATLTAQVGESSGSSIGTLITKSKIATISLNEVDIVKIKLGQKATLTFDAIESLSIDGEVVEIDSIGTVSSGVVTYNVKIGFESDDEKIKPGMSTSTSIITSTINDIVFVPNSAIKNKKGKNYVEIFDPSISRFTDGVNNVFPKEVEVEIGLANDSNTQIISGLKEGDVVVTRTIAGNNNASSNKTPSIMNAVGAKGMGGGRPMN